MTHWTPDLMPEDRRPVGFHTPMRKLWECSTCGGAWPCETKRQQLIAEFYHSPVSLGLLMGGYLIDASIDTPESRAGDLYTRFIAWISPYRRRYERDRRE